MRAIIRTLTLSVLLSLVACSPAGEGQTTLTITGSSTCAPLVAEIARRYEQLHPGVRIDVQSGGSSRGIGDVSKGLADIGMSSRALKPAEREGREAHLMAHDGLCFVVHADNPVDELSEDQLRAIYRGELDSWKALGGPDGAITVIDRAAGRAELSQVQKHFGLSAEEIKADAVAGETMQLLKQVASDPLAIGYGSLGSAEAEVARGAKLKLLPLRGVAASSQMVAAGKFPLSRPLILVVKAGEQRPAVRAFIQYALSPAVDDLIVASAYVPPVRD